jgi:glycosyltransferase involved in cell wall biosynthesis
VVVEMNIGIISERLNRPLTGVATYTQNLIREMSRIYPKDKIYLIDYRDYETFEDLNKIIIAPWIKYLPQKSYFWHLYLQFKLRNNNLNLDIIHSPENATLFVKLKNQKKLITVHDIRTYIFPKFNKDTILSHLFFPRTLKTTDKIIADSNSTKQDLIRYFNVPKEKIAVILLAADEKFKPLNHEEVNEVKQKYTLNFPFILYVGNLTKHKNIPMLIKAFYKVKKKGIQHKLVITGMKRGKYKEIFEVTDKLNLQNDVIFTGYILDEDLPALYNAADLFVYPSIYEGFGLPPLEAMACGTPVITSNTSSLPEVVGDGGITVDPYDVDGLAEAMYEILNNDGLREDMIKKGLERAKMFSWEKCARETLKVYEEVYNKRRG